MTGLVGLLRLFADALHPELPEGTPSVLLYLQKKATNRKLAWKWCGNNNNFPVSLTEHDVRELNEGVWRSLPPLELLPDTREGPQKLATSLPEPEWKKYTDALAASPPKGWQLIPVWRNLVFEQWVMNDEARKEWKRLLEQQAISGHLTPRSDVSGIPTRHMVGRQLMDAFLTVAEFTEFACQFDVAVQMPPSYVRTSPEEEQAQSAHTGGVDYTTLATRKQLIDAFGTFTGMDESWFRNLGDTPKLREARKIPGRGGRNSVRAEPFFCPFEVMLWLMCPRQKKGKKLSETTGWRLLRRHFPDVYEQHQTKGPDLD